MSQRDERLLGHSRDLRRSQTLVERKLWSLLRSRQLNGLKFRRQYVIEPYIVDFCCVEKRLIVELDGGQHDGRRYQDTERTQFLESKGYRVIRFWNSEVLENLDGVMGIILKTLENFSPLEGRRDG